MLLGVMATAGADIR